METDISVKRGAVTESWAGIPAKTKMLKISEKFKRLPMISS